MRAGPRSRKPSSQVKLQEDPKASSPVEEKLQFTEPCAGGSGAPQVTAVTQSRAVSGAGWAAWARVEETHLAVNPTPPPGLRYLRTRAPRGPSAPTPCTGGAGPQ